MRTLTRRSLMVVAMAVAMSSVGLAGDVDPGRQCSVQTLKGSYVLAANGFNITAGVAQPKAIVELIDFNGDGTLAVTGGTVSINGNVIPIAPTGSGTYTLESDCNGAIAFTSGPSFHLFLATDGKSGWVIQSNINTVFPGTLTRR